MASIPASVPPAVPHGDGLSLATHLAITAGVLAAGIALIGGVSMLLGW